MNEKSCTCSTCSVEKGNTKITEKKLFYLILGSVLFFAGFIFGKESAGIYFFIVSYILLGKNILSKAAFNIKAGKVLDENFLMAVASLGAMMTGEIPEAAAVILFYRVGEYFESIASDSARNSIKNLLKIKSEYANLFQNGKYVKARPESILPGQRILIKPGERIPLDSVVISGESSLNTSVITGESVPVYVCAGDEILSGSINNEGTLEAEVVKKYEDSTVAVILNMVENARNRKSETEKFISKFAAYYTPAVVASAAFIGFFVPFLINGDYSEWIYRGLVFLVISCPCALVLSIPLTYFGGLGAASAKGILIKGSNYLEAMTNVKTVVFDKTGTLTKGVLELEKIIAAENYSEREVIKYAAYAEVYSNHPLASAVTEAYDDEIDIHLIEKHKEIPGYGVEVYIEGKKILAGNERLLDQHDITYDSKEEIGTAIHVAVEKKYIGSIVFTDRIKEESKKALAEMRNEGIEKIIMLTGDNDKTARKISMELGIDEYYSRLLPQDKVSVLEKYIGSEKRIIFAGDGINDAPAIARADIGIAMGKNGSAVTAETADIVLMDDNPRKIAEAIKISKDTRNIVGQNIIFVLGIKILVMFLGTTGMAAMYQAVIADVGAAVVAVLNASRILKK